MGVRRFRFAPTPSRLLHVGNGLAALVGWASARRLGGTFVLRIEDIDTERCKPELEAACMEDLRWLGIAWDEGPDVGGPHGPYRQSERFDRFDAALEQLGEAGHSYVCVCSRAQVRAAQTAPHLHTGSERPYPGTCRALDATLDPNRGGHRLAVEALGEAAVCSWADTWTGQQAEDVRATCGDFLLGRPGAPSYQLAVVLDDAAMGITDVVRGRDLAGSTARQRVLHTLLGHEVPRFAHHPLLLDDDARKLSKRDEALTLKALRDHGVDAEQVIARLAEAIGLAPPGTTRLTAEGFASLLTDCPSWRDGTWTDLR